MVCPLHPCEACLLELGSPSMSVHQFEERQVMLKFNFVPNSANRLFQKLEVNLVSLSKVNSLGNPYNLKISFMNIFAMESALYVDLTGIKRDAFVNLSTTTMMESCCLIVIQNPVIKSMEITSHFHSRTGKGCNKPTGC